MKFFKLYGIIILFCLYEISNAQSNGCVAPFYIKSLETQDFGNQLNAIIQIHNPDNRILEILMSEDGGSTYSTKTLTNNSFNLLLGIPKKDLYFKLRSSGMCISESSIVQNIVPKANNNRYGQIDIVWNLVGNQTIYELRRFGGIPFNQKGLAHTNYSDKNVECSGNYLYQIIGFYIDSNGNQTEIISHYARSNANYVQNPLPKKALLATISNDGTPQLSILDVTGNLTYSIYRSINANPYQHIATIKDSLFTDSGNANENQYCYYINYRDACNNLSSNSEKTCTILLKEDMNSLEWNTPIYDASVPVSYDVVKLPNEIINSQKSNSFTIQNINPNLKQEQYQIVSTIDFVIDGKMYTTKTISNPVTINYITNIYFPNAFTPNNDGINDFFEVKSDSINIKEFKLWIFNRWGLIIYETNNISNTWDGTYKGEKVNGENYFVKIVYVDRFGQPHTKLGQINIIK